MTTTEWRGDAGRAGASRALYTTVHTLRGRLLVLPVAGSLLLYCALFLLLGGRSFRLTQTLTLRRFPALGSVWARLTPDSFPNTSWQTAQAVQHRYAYALVVIGLVLLWGLALWLTRPGTRTLALRWLLMPVGLFSLPLIWAPGMHSGDLYLYMFYGRMLARYSANPILVTPNQFPADPHLGWVYWTWLPSAYGPVWLMFTGALSAIAGNALWANIFTYKLAALLLHVLATVAVWSLLRGTRPELATWGTIFYGWNPLVLYETVGSGHNEVMVALFIALSLLAAARSRWPHAVFFLIAAAMVKLTALLFLPALVLAWAAGLPTLRARVRAAVLAAGVAVAGALALYAPLWGGGALVRNALDNPAATRYLNSFWELAALRTIGASGNPAIVSAHPVFDLVRNLLFVGALLYILWRVVWGARLEDAWIWLWFAYCLSLGWIWPWYFVVLVPVAAVRGPGISSALVAALSLGGLLFWIGWPDPALPAAPWMHNYRALILFAPAVLVAAWPAIRGRVERAIGGEVGAA